MILKELRMAKREIETLKNQLEVKEKSIANYRADVTKLRKDNIDLRKQMINLKGDLDVMRQKEQLANERQREVQREANPRQVRAGGGAQAEGGEGAGARAGRRERGGDMEAQMMMALQLNEMEHRMQERQMLMMALH